jgi:DNA modification methylase
MERIKEIPDGTFHAVVTSPPYFSLRSYLPAGHADKGKEIGSETTPDCGASGMMRLRNDLTEEEIAYVLSELTRRCEVR